MSSTIADTSSRDAPARSASVVKRHGVFTRAWHWINLICLIVLLMSGLQIFNAHPALYWGADSTFSSPWLSIGAHSGPGGGAVGTLDISGLTFTTTGVLGVSTDQGQQAVRAFPSWATLPSSQWLSLGRQWHFTAAWLFAPLLFAYLVYSLISRRRRRLIAPEREDLREFGPSIIEHVKLRFHAARRYNPIQKTTYLLVLFGLLPLMVATGLAMSPTMDAAWPWLPALLGGHQSARSIHFITAFLLLAFFVVHLGLVLVSGVLNNMRAMITGGFRVDDNTPAEQHNEGSGHAR